MNFSNSPTVETFTAGFSPLQDQFLDIKDSLDNLQSKQPLNGKWLLLGFLGNERMRVLGVCQLAKFGQI